MRVSADSIGGAVMTMNAAGKEVPLNSAPFRCLRRVSLILLGVEFSCQAETPGGYIEWGGYGSGFPMSAEGSTWLTTHRTIK